MVGGDGHLYEYSTRDGVTWSLSDVTAASQTALPNGVHLSGTASGYAFTASGESVPRRSVFVTGSDGHLYNYNWVQPTSGSGVWDLTDVSGGVSSGPTVGASSVSLVGSPSALYVTHGGSGLFEVYETGSDGHLYEYTFQPSGWTVTDVSSQAGQPGSIQVAGSPSAVTLQVPDSGGGAAQMDSVFAVTGDGQLAIFTYQPGTNQVWTFSEAGAPAGAILAPSTPAGFAFS
jgi:hypothetical protein